jgi:predicted PhzF superfamily epimerase YddE/YHI9
MFLRRQRSRENPPAVVLNLAGLTTEKMQAIAREFNLSARGTDVRVAGSTVLVASGRLFLP